MRTADFVGDVARLGGFADEGRAWAAVEATLEALGAVLVPSERRALSEALPSGLRGFLESAEHEPDLDLERFFARVQRHEKVPPGRAREHAEIVCRALVDAVSPETVALLVKHLPALEPLFVLRERVPGAPDPEVLRPRPPPDTWLATARPGSRHPLADARPEKAQAHSVARSSDPHADTKLSSSRGLTQEREHETLADAHPGAKRPLSG